VAVFAVRRCRYLRFSDLIPEWISSVWEITRRVIAWFAVWLEAGWEILFLIKDSVEWLSLAAATLEKLSFFILMFFFFGISLLIWLLFGKPVLMRENALSQSEDKNDRILSTLENRNFDLYFDGFVFTIFGAQRVYGMMP
jgi:hypothetical protein